MTTGAQALQSRQFFAGKADSRPSMSLKEKVVVSKQKQAFPALQSLYRHVIRPKVGDLGEIIRTRKPKRPSVVMTRDEVKVVPSNLTGDKRLMASLQNHLKKVKAILECDLADGWGRVRMPGAPVRKSPNAPKDRCREWVLPPVTPLPGICLRRARHPHHPGTAWAQSISITVIYTHILDRGGRGVRSPVDGPLPGISSLHKPELPKE